MAMDMFGVKRHPTYEESLADQELSSLRGQAVGFFTEIEHWLDSAVKHLDDWLNNQPPKDLLKLANDGLNCDEQQWIKSFSVEEQAALYPRLMMGWQVQLQL